MRSIYIHYIFMNALNRIEKIENVINWYLIRRQKKKRAAFVATDKIGKNWYLIYQSPLAWNCVKIRFSESNRRILFLVHLYREFKTFKTLALMIRQNRLIHLLLCRVCSFGKCLCVTKDCAHIRGRINISSTL